MADVQETTMATTYSEEAIQSKSRPPIQSVMFYSWWHLSHPSFNPPATTPRFIILRLSLHDSELNKDFTSISAPIHIATSG